MNVSHVSAARCNVDDYMCSHLQIVMQLLCRLRVMMHALLHSLFKQKLSKVDLCNTCSTQVMLRLSC